jgi:hypothetical protein
MSCDGTGHLMANVSQLKPIHIWLRSICSVWLANAWALNTLGAVAELFAIRLRIGGHPNM